MNSKYGIFTKLISLFLTFFVCAGTLSAETFRQEKPAQPLMTRQILDASLKAGTRFILNNQTKTGNFNYEYNFLTKEINETDNQVRQAGGLWGLAIIHSDSPTPETLNAIEKGLAFFDSISKETADGKKYIVYPNEKDGKTGTIALLVMTLVDFLQTEKKLRNRGYYLSNLEKYVSFLLSLRMESGQFNMFYRLDTGEGYGGPSPYFDGESLLALIKLYEFQNQKELKEIILESADIMYENNVRKALRKHPDSPVTKGFYQWCSMAFLAIYKTGWKDTEKYADMVINLSYWMIDVHQTLRRRKNTSYAFEGIISAWEAARLQKNTAAMNKISTILPIGLARLTSWQIGGPIENTFLKQHPTQDPLAVGGVMSSKNDPVLRIDETQHQMHAVILARRYFYTLKTESKI